MPCGIGYICPSLPAGWAASSNRPVAFVVSHNLLLDRAPEGYQHFDVRDSGWTKVVLAPAA